MLLAADHPGQTVRRPARAGDVAAVLFGRPPRGRAVTVREMVVPRPVRFAHALAGAAIVRDAAAFAALVVFGTMLSVLTGVVLPV